ncbi:hypothetical protein COS44_00930 [bacterium (Candidatus Gribaldobacteria) CG03_land_8_20_14_0_80_36_40]|uniref:Uncharacterized protein n=1 Tax=bacterium (Candidatus Gribaldobacteria) CG03_land_8_20_14_0_80_36_40 TaxID=2014271 RepID=A0A2M7BZC2_9BACT|nr:MAG: hypothetical protein COS44_00930 [bacterium (Candidatus Gribaldobacteria) CG03_land_8_20_14_0_80_36_40]
MDVNDRLLFKIKKISKQEGFDSTIFASRASPSKLKKEIREGYIKILSSFWPGIPLLMFEENNNRHSQEEKLKMLKIIEMRWEKIFRDYLRNIKDKYKNQETIWKIKNN